MTTIATRDVNALFERTELQKKIDAEVLARVKKGFLLLQEKYGEEWVDKIDMRSLDLASCSACVLGQVYGDYSRGTKTLGINHYGDDDEYVSVKYGFEMGDGIGYEDLDDAWKAVLREAYASFA